MTYVTDLEAALKEMAAQRESCLNNITDKSMHDDRAKGVAFGIEYAQEILSSLIEKAKGKALTGQDVHIFCHGIDMYLGEKHNQKYKDKLQYFTEGAKHENQREETI